MRCDHCEKGKLIAKTGLYHYTESGLPNLYLENVKWLQCKHCHAREVEIPRIGMLHRCIAWLIITKPSLLTGQEIVFLRKMLGKSQKEFAELLGLSQVVLNRWETGARKGHGSANDTKIRFLCLTLQDDEYTHRINQKIWELLFKFFGRIQKSPSPLHASINPQTCTPEEVSSVTIEHLLATQTKAPGINRHTG